MIYEDINHVNDCSDLRNDEATGEIYIPLSFFVVKCTFGRCYSFFLLFFFFFFFYKLPEVIRSEEYVATIFSGYPGECLTLVHQICQRQNTFLSGKNSEKWKATKKLFV